MCKDTKNIVFCKSYIRFFSYCGVNACILQYELTHAVV